VDWIHLAQDTGYWLALVNTVINLLVSKIVEKILTRRGNVSFLKITLYHEIDSYCISLGLF
jgi:hypothetical protein